MLFYKIEATCENEIGISKRENREEYDVFVSELKERSESFYEKSGETCFFFVSKIIKKRLTIGGILKKADKVERCLESYLEKTSFIPNKIHCEETTLQVISSMLCCGTRCLFLTEEKLVQEGALKHGHFYPADSDVQCPFSISPLYRAEICKEIPEELHLLEDIGHMLKQNPSMAKKLDKFFCENQTLKFVEEQYEK